MSANNHVCAFCDVIFTNADELREHFRSHAIIKPRAVFKKPVSKHNDVENVPSVVPCDVCDETFDTVTKAISHKFRKHPGVPNKNFCPWCGKQFPIKQVCDNHIATHKDGSEPAFKLPCAECNAEFYTGEAVKYHSQSFHRKAHLYQEVHIAPPSNKIYLNSHGDLLSVYYCHLCGQEYIIKYNLQKHITNVHGPEPVQAPADLVKCKTCSALFYSVAAYEFHNTFHKLGDLYVTSEEMRKQVVTKVDQDFDFRRVKVPTTPQSLAKKFPKGPFGTNLLPSNPLQALIDSQMKKEHDATLNESPAPFAITLDEFVNMNKEVFSNNFDSDVSDSPDTNDEPSSPKRSDSNSESVSLPQIEKSNIEKMLSGMKKASVVIKQIPLPKGALKPGESEKMQKKGLILPQIEKSNIEKMLSGMKKASVVIKRIPLPKGALKPGLKVMTKGELEKMQKKGLVALVKKSKVPVTANSLQVLPTSKLKKTIKIMSK